MKFLGKKHGCQKWSDFEYCVRKLILKQFLDGKHDGKLADRVSTPEAIVSKILKEKYFWSYAEMKLHSSCHVGLQVITISAEGL